MLVHDDLLATGGTAGALCRLVEEAGATVAGCAFVVELAFLKGRERLVPHDVHSLVTYEGMTVPTVVRTQTVGATPQRLWDVVADPERLPEWWPGVRRVEDASAGRGTTVLGAPKGKSIRADYTLLGAEHPRRLSWRHEVAESPFARIISESVTVLELEAANDGTLVSLTTRLRLRGLSRFGGLQVTRATRRQLDGALEGLQALVRDAEVR